MRPTRRYPLITLGLTAAAAVTLTLAADLPGLIAYLGSINAVTFLTYAWDKRAAGRRRPRVPEATLHLLALLGGSPAALLGQQLLRHKTVKRSFQLMYWAIVVLQAVLLTLWLRG